MVDDRNQYACTSNPAELHTIRELVKSSCEKFGLSESVTNSVVLAIDEACANVIRHGYQNDEHGYMCIETFEENGYGVFLIKDNCMPIDEKVLLPKQSDILEPGGLGLHLIHQVMDSVSLIPHGEHGNHLELKIKL